MLGTLFFYLSLPLIYLLSLLPFWVLYRISDLLYVLLFHLIGYRRGVVQANLRRAFPEKSPGERSAIARAFYAHLCDLLVESLKLVTISRRSLRRRMRITNEELIEDLHRAGQSIILVLGHYGNWEMMGHAVSAGDSIPVNSIYRPVKNKSVDRFLYRTRKRFGMDLVPMQETLRTMLAQRDRSTMTAFLADQAPHPQHAIWLTFLNQPTPVFAGPEKLARKLGFPVLFATCSKVRRGYYTMAYELLSDDPQDSAPGEITALHTRRLERQITEAPAFWLWSHRRWKHQPPADWNTQEAVS